MESSFAPKRLWLFPNDGNPPSIASPSMVVTIKIIINEVSVIPRTRNNVEKLKQTLLYFIDKKTEVQTIPRE